MNKIQFPKIYKQAKILAEENTRSDPQIMAIYWFPNETEVRLVEIDNNAACSTSVEPFYFDPSPADDLPAPSGIAIIRSEEYRQIPLPEGWGTWADAKELIKK